MSKPRIDVTMIMPTSQNEMCCDQNRTWQFVEHFLSKQSETISHIYTAVKQCATHIFSAPFGHFSLPVIRPTHLCEPSRSKYDQMTTQHQQASSSSQYNILATWRYTACLDSVEAGGSLEIAHSSSGPHSSVISVICRAPPAGWLTSADLRCGGTWPAWWTVPTD